MFAGWPDCRVTRGTAGPSHVMRLSRLKRRLKRPIVWFLRLILQVTRRIGLNPVLRTAAAQGLGEDGFLMLFPPYDTSVEKLVTAARDPVRYSTLALVLKRIEREEIQGSLAEVGVWQGYTSRIIHAIMPGRTSYLFDTFEGFALRPGEEADERFKDTSVDMLRSVLGDLDDIVIRKGIFPDTATGLEAERFSFVLLDLDKYSPTMEGLRFFYPRTTQGGYIFIHDYHSPESQHGVSRAVDEFMAGRSENIIEIPDLCGSVMIRKA